ncbi:MAG: hypothetical protein L0Z62_25675 [Gemmataceae bacterium]|nr:hypothetical protein [Gemmataceae bacterium]
MTITQPPQQAAAPRRSGRRWLVLAVVLILLIGGLFAGGVDLHHRQAADSSLQEALNEADRFDPGWRLQDIQAKRAVIPDHENGALHVLRVVKQLPKGWGESELFMKLFQTDELPPEVQLTEPQIKVLRAELTRAGAALAEARKMKGFERGRLAITYGDDGSSTPPWPYHDLRAVASVLSHDAQMRSQDGDSDGALESCRAVLNCGRAVGDEPNLVAQLIRMNLRGVAVGQVERALAQGQPSAGALKELLRLLQDEQAQPLLRIVLRGERAGMDRLAEAVQLGKANIDHLLLGAKLGGALAGGKPTTDSERRSLHNAIAVKHQRAALLRHMTRVVETANLPAAEQRRQLEQLEANAKEQPGLLRLVASPLSKVARGYQRSQAHLRCAIVAVAAELHRRERAAWPESPEKLVAAGYLKAVPFDPFDGKPLRWRLANGCLRIYSVGPDGQDDGGTTLLSSLDNGSDLVFRLWDVERRRRLPLPPPVRPSFAPEEADPAPDDPD